METSKKITWVFIALYIIVLGLGIYLNTIGYDIDFIIRYVHQIMIVIIVSYFGKAGVENYQKITNNYEASKEYEDCNGDDI